VADSRTTDELLADIVTDFAAVIDFALKVSMSATGEPTTKAGEWGSIVFAKMCVNAISAKTLVTQEIFDHIAIVTVCRIMMESMTLYFYLHEDVASTEWQCRELAIALHDTTGRIKLMRGWQAKEEYADLIAGQDSLKAEMKANSFFQTLFSEQQTRLLSGEHFYIGGMNAAAVRAGWDQRNHCAV